ncbi:terminase small subunit [Labedaea rhizosphaerae]|uniref:Terminase small subunit actinomycetes phage-type domain-containing protein n=1 Tax=Labedaea rhizosphaerae TaxID=598644 RepID=A0A4R6SET0_LABRH|nr:hypothetical protein [Labedaea rhizosphaerae]TDP97655.1 hypothetical protein EV186_103619 [Labedaea rhizosphaerae]
MTDRLSPSVANAVQKGLTAAKISQSAPTDAGLVALAKRYAAVIEEAQVWADEAALIEPEDDDQWQRIERLRKRVDAVTVLADLGPKLLAALVELGLTPRVRAAAGRGGGGAGDSGGPGKYDELKGRRATRAQRAGAGEH